MNTADIEVKAANAKRIIYNDGRKGHSGVMADIISSDKTGMTVQFADRADTTRIPFASREWMNFIVFAD
jgi:hypothetical protein